MKLFRWGLLLRYTVYGVLPLILLFIFLEQFFSEGASGFLFVVISMILPFFAVTWLAYQHFRFRNRSPVDDDRPR